MRKKRDIIISDPELKDYYHCGKSEGIHRMRFYIQSNQVLGCISNVVRKSEKKNSFKIKDFVRIRDEIEVKINKQCNATLEVSKEKLLRTAKRYDFIFEVVDDETVKIKESVTDSMIEDYFTCTIPTDIKNVIEKCLKEKWY